MQNMAAFTTVWLSVHTQVHNPDICSIYLKHKQATRKYFLPVFILLRKPTMAIYRILNAASVPDIRRWHQHDAASQLGFQLHDVQHRGRRTIQARSLCDELWIQL